MPPSRAVPSAAERRMVGSADPEPADAALVEHYTRLTRIGYLVLPSSLGRGRRVLTAHGLVQRSLPRSRAVEAVGGVPQPRGPEGAAAVDPGYADLRLRVVRSALEARGSLRPRSRSRWLRVPTRARRAWGSLLAPRVWGLQLFPRSGGADELALEQTLSTASGPCRAAHVLRGLEGLPDPEVCRLLAAAGVADPGAALAEANTVTAPYALLASPEFDPCSLQVRPTDLLLRRRRARAARAGLAALTACGALLVMPGGGWGPDAAPPPASAHHPAARQALDPAALQRVPPSSWRHSARTDFTAWPARGNRTGDTGLLRRALAAWTLPGHADRATATPGTPTGPPMGPPQLLYAGVVDEAVVVLLHDGLRIVRYAESRRAAPDRGALLDFARVDGADSAAANALVVGRAGGRVRYLTAPWVRAVAVRDLLAPHAAPRALPRDADGVTGPLAGLRDTADGCHSWEALEVRDAESVRWMTDLGELTPVRLTSGIPSAPHDVSGRAERESWARTACLLPAVRAGGVRSVNSWLFARQPLPEGNGSARWLCVRAETWRGTGSRVLAEFQAPAATTAPGAVVARAEDSPACGPRDPHVLAGVLWKSAGGRWYLVAAGSGQFASLSTSGGVVGSSRGRLLTVRAGAGDRAELSGLLADGRKVGALR
ncbi:hypothetical protein F0344_27330 [Streptomyces finlayi]|uniref:Uncharacterized protein n=1 Tax=Streptomyces finlayi TaxID=67296 RepID=A0A7G7BR44_9ACTN|nr:hypothetical protein [Streptomyces finlayi]QNE77809.1 hypothetical protein F0344_27330 [Streptomyces finlayi]